MTLEEALQEVSNTIEGFEYTSVNSSSPEGCSPLHIAAFWSRIDLIEVLLAHDADINHEDSHGYRPLHMAIEANSYDAYDAVIMLVENGAKDSGIPGSMSSLEMAMWGKNQKVIDYLKSEHFKLPEETL